MWIWQNLDFHNFLAEVLKTRIARIARLSHMPGFPKYSHIYLSCWGEATNFHVTEDIEKEISVDDTMKKDKSNLCSRWPLIYECFLQALMAVHMYLRVGQ